MITLYSIFTSNALFLSDSPLTVRGKCKPGANVTLTLYKGGEYVLSSAGCADGNGEFSVCFRTPQPSFDAYSYTVDDGCDKAEATGILFGELWFAGGQSNMELSNVFFPDREQLYEKLRGRKVRIYAQSWMGGRGGDSDFPQEPQPQLDGEWLDCTNGKALDNVSALATSAMPGIFDFLNRHADIPVGFLNISVGGSGIAAWLPEDVLKSDPAVCENLYARGKWVEGRAWNACGGLNFNQPSALYNLKVAPALGVKVRGVLWYQGEDDIWDRRCYGYYRAALKLYYGFYKENFGCGDFYLIASGLYPYLYGTDKCRIGYISEAIADAAAEIGGGMRAVMCYDLKPLWAAGMYNHPIHPTNKYALGARFADVMNAAYGAPGADTATVRDYTFANGRVEVKFRTGGFELTAKSLRGLYIAADDGVYYEANAEIAPPDTLILSHPGCPAPTKAAYRYHDTECGAGLYCGELPVSPFASDKTGDIVIKPKPWLHTEVENVTVLTRADEYYDFYARPTWLPLDGCEICRDYTFTSGEASLRVRGKYGVIGAYVQSYPGFELDLYKFKKLSFTLIGCKAYTCEAEFVYCKARQTLACVKTEDLSADAARYSLDLSVLPKKDADALLIKINTFDNPPLVSTAALDEFAIA